MADRKEEAFSALKSLADLLNIKLDDDKIAIAGPNNSAKVRMYDGSLEAEIIPTARGDVNIESPRAPGIKITLVDHNRDNAPEGAIYEISAYRTFYEEGRKVTEALNGDIYSVYVGKNGLILDGSARERAKKLPKTRP